MFFLYFTSLLSNAGWVLSRVNGGTNLHSGGVSRQDPRLKPSKNNAFAIKDRELLNVSSMLVARQVVRVNGGSNRDSLNRL